MLRAILGLTFGRLSEQKLFSHNGPRIDEGGDLKPVSPNIAQMLIETQMLNYFLQPRFWQYLVERSLRQPLRFQAQAPVPRQR
jgi:hypothetical protein